MVTLPVVAVLNGWLARKMAAESARPVETEHTGMVERAWQSTLSALRGFGGAPGADEDGE